MGTPSVVEWPDIGSCLYYQTNFPNFPFNGVEMSNLPMSTDSRQLLAVENDFLRTVFVLTRLFLGYSDL